MARLSSSLGRLFVAAGLVVVAFFLARLGRSLLDGLIADYPQWSAPIERFGGWALGMLFVLCVVIPLFRLYGLFPAKRRQRDSVP